MEAWSMLLGAGLLGETPTVSNVLGFLCILAGFGLVKRRVLHQEFVRLWRDQ
jgi:drug/metabolite transporter (DMT)-like permease